jgi:Uncharacterized alpha/beta hydrolase domain (DUF2235)
MKRLVCSLDGTWNDDDGEKPLTNVAKLNRAILFEDSRGVRQLNRYVVGIASSEDLGFAFLKGAMGFEVGDRIKAGYQFLSNVYEPGDEIYLFGFSRGAYEARSLASFITLFGLAKKGSNFSIDEAWSIYRRPDHERDFNAVAEISAACHYPVRIRCLGVWDTVGNIGNPYWSMGWLGRKFDYHDTRLHDTIDVALHALSIDETRSPFRPTLFTYPEDEQPPSHQHIEQRWFAGTHADVGGGWPETDLSDIALLWMAERVQATTDLAIDIDKLKREAKPDPLGLQHSSSTGWLYAFSQIVPYVRLIKQNLHCLSERHRFFKSWRTSKVGSGLISLNEAVHESALARLDRSVREERNNLIREIIYKPATLIGHENVIANADTLIVPHHHEADTPLRIEEPVSEIPAEAPEEAGADFTSEPSAPLAQIEPQYPADVEVEVAADPPVEPPTEILSSEPEPPDNRAPASNGAIEDFSKGAEMPEAPSALKLRDPEIANEPTPVPISPAQAKIKVVTVHGTGAGSEADIGQSWWQKDSAFQKKTAEIIELAGDGIEVVPFHWGTGPNSETKRREAGTKLYQQLREYDNAGVDYYLIGHSHGGSVIYNGLLRSAAKDEPLDRLRAWLTVGTPFLDFKPSWLLFNRLNVWGQGVYVTGIGFLLLAIGLIASKYFELPFAQMVNASLGDKAFSNFYYPVLSFILAYLVICFGLLTLSERLTKRWYSDRHKAKVRDLYEKSWIGLWHHDDEAISALTNVRALNRAIIPSNFLVPVFSLIPLLLTIFGLGYAAYFSIHAWNPDAQWLKDIFSKLAAIDSDPRHDWAPQHILSMLWDLAAAVTIIMGPIIAIYLLLTTAGVGLVRGFAHLIGIPLAKAIDRLVWDSVRQETWGNDRRGESVRSVSATPPFFKPRYSPLPEAVASKIARYSETHATETLRKARELLGMTATSTSMGDIGRDLSAQLSWRELIHTSYFEINEFIALLAAALHGRGLSRSKAEKIADAISDDMAEGWLKDISTLPQPLPANEVRSRG